MLYTSRRAYLCFCWRLHRKCRLYVFEHYNDYPHNSPTRPGPNAKSVIYNEAINHRAGERTPTPFHIKRVPVSVRACLCAVQFVIDTMVVCLVGSAILPEHGNDIRKAPHTNTHIGRLAGHKYTCILFKFQSGRSNRTRQGTVS